ncbi:MAG: IPT/TIG domain-containing protein [Sandaracinaceae bacterium]|nr:IPT/TIG domain-containing protein [Sandaracinaceae bacterium]
MDIFASYLTVFDHSRGSDINLVDALNLGDRTPRRVVQRDGFATVLVAESTLRTELLFVDTLVRDVEDASPGYGEAAFPPGAPIWVRFDRGIAEGELEEIEPYIELAQVDGSPAGADVQISMSVDPQDDRVARVVPAQALSPNTEYVLRLVGVPATRRTIGLFDHEIPFRTAAAGAVRPTLHNITPRYVETTGGDVRVEVHNAVSPSFVIGAAAAPIVNTEPLAGGVTRYTLRVTGSLAGPAVVEVTNQGGPRDEWVGGVQFLAPLRLDSVTPPAGSLSGGTLVTLRGAGFRPGTTDATVLFGNVPVPSENVSVLSGEEISVRTPGGFLGAVDVSVVLSNGQQVTATDGFRYFQPLQSRIPGEAVTDVRYDAMLDPSGTYLLSAEGGTLRVYNVDASAYSGRLDEQLLLGLIDEPPNADRIDDRILTSVPLGMTGLGIDTYFDRGVDRVLSAGVSGGHAMLTILGFDAGDLDASSVVGRLSLPGSLARGIDATNGRALVAMGDAGLGIVDIHLASEPYLVDQWVLPDQRQALDVVQIETPAGANEVYAVVAGHFNVPTGDLEDEATPSTGGFYLVGHGPALGFELLGSLPIPGSRGSSRGSTRISRVGAQGSSSWTSETHGTRPWSVAWMASATYWTWTSWAPPPTWPVRGVGVVVLDVSNPAAPRIADGMESGADARVVVATPYSAIGVGSSVGVTPDVTLKLFRVDPANRIVDRDTLGREQVIFRFSKAIDLYAPNLQRFYLETVAGTRIPASVEIVNNDAIVTLTAGHGLALGQPLTAVAEGGLRSVKPVAEGQFITLYTMPGTRRRNRGEKKSSRWCTAVPAPTASPSTPWSRGASSATCPRW